MSSEGDIGIQSFKLKQYMDGMKKRQKDRKRGENKNEKKKK